MLIGDAKRASQIVNTNVNFCIAESTVAEDDKS